MKADASQSYLHLMKSLLRTHAATAILAAACWLLSPAATQAQTPVADYLQFTDEGNLATLGNLLTIFKDENLGAGGNVENTNGNLARLRLYNEVLTLAQVAALVPEPSTWAIWRAAGCCWVSSSFAVARRPERV